MMSSSLNLPETRTPSVLSKDTVWKAAKKSYLQSLVGASQTKMDPFFEATLDEQFEALSTDVRRH